MPKPISRDDVQLLRALGFIIGPQKPILAKVFATSEAMVHRILEREVAKDVPWMEKDQLGQLYLLVLNAAPRSTLAGEEVLEINAEVVEKAVRDFRVNQDLATAPEMPDA